MGFDESTIPAPRRGLHLQVGERADGGGRRRTSSSLGRGLQSARTRRWLELLLNYRVMKARRRLLDLRDRAQAKKAIADAQANDPNCIFGREVRRAEKAAHVVQRALKRATSSETGPPPLPPQKPRRAKPTRRVEPPAWLRAGISVEADWRGRGAWYRGTITEVSRRRVLCPVR